MELAGDCGGLRIYFYLSELLGRCGFRRRNRPNNSRRVADAIVGSRLVPRGYGHYSAAPPGLHSLVVNSSRAVLYASSGADFAARARAVAEATRASLI